MAQTPSVPAPGKYDDAWHQRAQTLYADGKYAEAQAILQMGVADGVADAMTALAYSHLYAPEFPGKNPALGIALFEKALALGDARAARYLSEQYHLGQAVPKDDAMAFAMIQKAAELGDSDALASVGMFHWKGVATPRDPAKAVEWFRRSVESGDPKGFYQLGMAYLDGIGVAADPERGLQLIQRSAEMGFSEAQAELPRAQRVVQAHRQPRQP
ncbi:tetratricopeptide repeat protein [Arenimonas sp. MALMAid1274]|uniref:tetratricopeptide repeat protein n=1 Tax=Arenimonas sp. MALMAid1274 TaxID=3411630 RepID=UPI003B9F6F62